MQGEGWPAHGHAIGDALDIGPVRVELTPADHAWQNASPGASDRVFQPEDACGFWIEVGVGHEFHAELVTELYAAAQASGYELVLSGVTPDRRNSAPRRTCWRSGGTR
jgi:hypothetical protein